MMADHLLCLFRSTMLACLAALALLAGCRELPVKPDAKGAEGGADGVRPISLREILGSAERQYVIFSESLYVRAGEDARNAVHGQIGISNDLGRDIRLVIAGVSCGCASVEVEPSVVPPDQFFTVAIRFTPRFQLSLQSEACWLRVDGDPDQQFSIGLAAEVVPVLEISPPPAKWSLAKVRPEQATDPIEATITLREPSSEPEAPVTLQSATGKLLLSLFPQPATVNESFRERRFTVRYRVRDMDLPEFLRGLPLDDQIAVQAGANQENFPVRLEVETPLRAQPSRLLLVATSSASSAETGVVIRRQFAIDAAVPVQWRSCETSDPRIQCELAAPGKIDGGPGDPVRLIVTAGPSGATGDRQPSRAGTPWQGWIRAVFGTGTGERVIEVPVTIIGQ